MSDLKPCPNCGSTELKHCYVYVRCTKCLMEGPKTNGGYNDDHADHMDYKWATESWNDLPRREHEPIIDPEKVIHVDPVMIKEGTSKP